MCDFSLTGFFCAITIAFGLAFLVTFLSPFTSKRRACLSLSLALIGGLIATGWAIAFWRQPSISGQIIIWGSPHLENLAFPALELYVDRLAALFMLLVGSFSSVVAVYSFAYLGLVSNGEQALENDAHGIAAAYSLFVYTMLLVIAANNVFTLLVCLEVMSLSFGYLVLYRHNKNRDTVGQFWDPRDKRVRKQAIQSYLISSHVSLVLLTAALLLRADQAGSLSFDAFRSSNEQAGALVFWLAFFGLGIRAGVTPFHIWIPLAHPSSPTNTHALSLGVAIKVAILLMIRVFFEFLGPIPDWWGPVVMIFAGLTAVVGVYYAIVSRDLKTALSCHSVENVGIILVGIGLALTLAAHSLPASPSIIGLGGLALIGGLYHTVNHSVFKGLLYLCTGAIEKLSGSVKYHDLGGLMARFPWTSVSFLVGAVSIAGFPPFNGFISEWITLQSLFASLGMFRAVALPIPALSAIVALLLLAVAFGLTAFAFVKIAGGAILGASRSKTHEGGQDVPWFARIVFFVLSGLCLLLGVFPSFVVSALAQVSASLGLPVTTLYEQGSGISFAFLAPAETGTYFAALDAWPLWLLAVGLLVVVSWRALGRRAKRSRESDASEPVWTSGIQYDGKAMQSTEAYFAYQVYAPLSRPTPSNPGSGAYAHTRPAGSPMEERLPLSDNREAIEFFRQAYNVFISGLLRFAEWFALALQSGRVRRYVTYGFLTLIILLAVLLALGGR